MLIRFTVVVCVGSALAAALAQAAAPDQVFSWDETSVHMSLGAPVELGDGLVFLGAGPSPTELQLNAVTNRRAADTTN